MKKLLKLAFTACVLVLFSAGLYGQRTVTGTVTDSDGLPMIGANVLEQGTSNGTITDIDGTYSIRVADNAVLVFSFTGFTTQTIAVGTSSTLDVSMSEGQFLEEVVVTGYGTLQAKEVTSSIASLKTEDFATGNITNVAQLLQGRVAGLSISKQGGNPNGNVQIRLRGLSTVGSNTEPLIIIDGVPGASLSSVDPQDIESIDILKDGSAAAIYGTRGATGVILVTTKKGKAGKTSVDYNGFVTADAPAKFVDMMTADEYRAYTPPTGLTRSPDGGFDTNWFKELTRTGVSHTHNLSLSGGSGSTNYRAAINLRDNQGVALNTGFDQLNGRLNLTQKALDDKMTMALNYSVTNRDERDIPSEAFAYAAVYNPTSPVYDNNAPDYGYYYEEIKFDYYNPVSIANQTDIDRNLKRSILSGKLDYELADGLTVGAFYSQQRENDFIGTYAKRTRLFGSQGRGSASRQTHDRESQLFELTGNYIVDLGGNKMLKLLAGYSYQDFENAGQGMSGGGFITDEFGYNNIAAASDFANGLGSVFTYKNSNKLVAFFGRANLNFDDTYFVSASIRREGSSKFGANNKWGMFPGVSAGVDLSKLMDSNSFDNLKFRVGYGVTGNTPNDSYLSFLGIGPTGANFFNNGTYVQSFGPTRNANPNLKWETKQDLNVGVDFSVMDFKLTGTLEYYNITTKDMILNFNVPVPPNLSGTTFVNVGDLSNSGLELTLSYNGIGNEGFSWTPTLTSTYYIDTKLNSLSDEANGLDFGGVQDIAGLGSPGQNGTPLIRIEEGAPLGQIWGLKFVEYKPDGTLVYEDSNGDGKLDDASDRQVIGSGIPNFEIGLNNQFSFGNFDAVLFVRGVFGHDLINTFRAFYEAPQAAASYNLYSSTPENAGSYKGAPKFSSLHVEAADFVRLENFEIGYTVPNSASSKFRNIRIFLNANNLFTITGYSGVLPDVRWADIGERGVSAASPNPLAPGIDRRGTYYSTRSFSLGVNLGF